MNAAYHPDPAAIDHLSYLDAGTPIRNRRPAQTRPARGLEAYLRMLAGPQPGVRLLEIRFALRGRQMGRVFLSAHNSPGAARLIGRLARRTDVYVGVALRTRSGGSRDAVDHCHLLFVDIDADDAVGGLAAFQRPPTAIVSSGTPGHAHAYWALRAPVGVVELEAANRRLAYRLGGDLACVDAARILRPPASLNHKHSPPTPVELGALDPARRYDVDQLLAGLDEPPASASLGAAAPRRSARTGLDRALLAIPAADYVARLVGASPDRAGKIACPLHDDHTPSLHLYDDRTWYCFACRAGGSVYDFAARLWGLDTKGRAFLELRARLASELGVMITE